MKDWEYLQSYAGKIEHLLTMEQPILSGDNHAVMFLEEKLKKLESDQAMMKAVNAYYRKNQILEGCQELTETLKKEIGCDFDYENKPFMTYQLTNQNTTIRNTRFRLEQLKKEKEAGKTERENRFFKFVENKELMRLQLISEEKPEPEVREILKTNGFKWSPKNGCWQRQLTGKWKVCCHESHPGAGENGGCGNRGGWSCEHQLSEKEEKKKYWKGRNTGLWICLQTVLPFQSFFLKEI